MGRLSTFFAGTKISSAWKNVEVVQKTIKKTHRFKPLYQKFKCFYVPFRRSQYYVSFNLLIKDIAGGSSIMKRRRSSPSKKPLDQCKPEDMIDVLLARLKDNPLDDDKKALLIVELEDLYLFFQKHPESVDMFRTDLIEWRTFLKQTKEYMNEFFDKKLQKTRKIIQFISDKTERSMPSNITSGKETHPTLHYNRKSHKPKDWDPRSSEPTFYEILFRPGIRSIREYPITEERYGERNNDVDQLHKLTAWLREKIIYAPLSKAPSKTKEELLKILISVVEISAYDVLHGIVFVEQLAQLVQSISQGEDYRKETHIFDAMKKITDNIKEHARAVWERNKITEKQMWDNINTISRKVELGKKPKFGEELLTKSAFLRMEKMKRGFQTTEHPIVIEAEASDKGNETYSTAEGSPEPLLLTGPPPSRTASSHHQVPLIEPPKLCTNCDEYRQKYGADFLKAMKEPEKKFKIQDIPEVEEEKETIFKMKPVPKFDYALLRKFTLPTQPDLFDVTDPLKTALRVVVGPETGATEQPPEGISYKSVRNPYVNRKRLLKY